MKPSFFSLCLLLFCGTFLVLGSIFLLFTRAMFHLNLRCELPLLNYEFHFSAMDPPTNPVTPKIVFDPMPTDPAKMGKWLKDGGPVMDQARYTYNRPQRGQKTFHATWYYLIAMYWSRKEEIFGRDGGQEQDPSKFTDKVIDKYLADASADDREFVKQAKNDLFMTDREVHRNVQKDFYAGVMTAIESNPLCKSYVENKLRNHSRHDLYIGIRAWYYVREWI